MSDPHKYFKTSEYGWNPKHGKQYWSPLYHRWVFYNPYLEENPPTPSKPQPTRSIRKPSKQIKPKPKKSQPKKDKKPPPQPPSKLAKQIPRSTKRTEKTLQDLSPLTQKAINWVVSGPARAAAEEQQAKSAARPLNIARVALGEIGTEINPPPKKRTEKPTIYGNPSKETKQRRARKAISTRAQSRKGDGIVGENKVMTGYKKGGKV